MAERFVKLNMDNANCAEVYVNPRNVSYFWPHRNQSSPDAKSIGTQIYFLGSADFEGTDVDHINVLQSPEEVRRLLEGYVTAEVTL